MLRGYFGAQKRKVNKFFWPELIPIVQSFFISLWNQERPAVRRASLVVLGDSFLLMSSLLAHHHHTLPCSPASSHSSHQDADEQLEFEGKEEKEGDAKVDYGYGTLAEAGLTPQTGWCCRPSHCIHATCVLFAEGNVSGG